MIAVYLLLAVLMGGCAAMGSVLLKQGVSKSSNLTEALFKLKVYYGAVLYIVAAAINIVLLQYLPYSIVVPMGALTYIWTLILSHRMLAESYSVNKISGTALIILGVSLLAIQH